MNGVAKPKPARAAKRPGSAPTPRGGASCQARRQTAAILEVLAGVRRPSEAAQALGTSLPRYYQLEQRALAGLVSACEPAPRGPRQDLARQVARLEREKQRLARECDRQQALVRVAQRCLGLAPPAPAKTSGKEEPAAGDGATAKRRRSRRPTVRALKAARALEREGVVTAGEATANPPLAVAASS